MASQPLDVNNIVSNPITPSKKNHRFQILDDRNIFQTPQSSLLT